MTTPKSIPASKNCRKCHCEMIQISRTSFDRFINLASLGTLRQSRYKCLACGQEQVFKVDQ